MTPTAADPVPAAAPGFLTVAQILDALGNVPAWRVRMRTPPGEATVQDVIDLEAREGRLFELIDGVLVEKAVGYYESRVVFILGGILDRFLEQNDLGVAAGEAGMMRLTTGLVRIPDLSFVLWAKFPGRLLPAEPVPNLTPDLAVEVLSENNTPKEMERKRGEYFRSGTRLVWEIDPDAQTADVYTAPDQVTHVPADGVLDGGDVLPGFRVSLRHLFARAGHQPGR